jgi:hypothetical protein
LLEKCGVHAEFERQRAPQAPADLIDQLAHEGLGALAVMDVAGTVFEPQDLREVRKQRVVARVLGVKGIEATYGPRDLAAGADHGAVDVDRQSAQIELLNLLIEQLTVDPHQCDQRGLSELLEPVDDRAIAGNAGETTEPREQRIAGHVA